MGPLLHIHPCFRYTPNKQLLLAMTGQGPMMVLLGGWIQGRVPGRPQMWTWGYLGGELGLVGPRMWEHNLEVVFFGPKYSASSSS